MNLRKPMNSAFYVSLSLFIVSILVAAYFYSGLEKGIIYKASEPPFIYLLWSGLVMSFAFILTLYFFEIRRAKSKSRKIYANIFFGIFILALSFFWSQSGLFG